MSLTLYFQSSLKMTFGAKITIFTLKKRCAQFQEKGKSYKKEKNLNRQFGFLHFELQLKHEIAETFHHKVVFKFCQNNVLGKCMSHTLTILLLIFIVFFIL